MRKINVSVPDAISGPWSIETFEVSKKNADLFNRHIKQKELPDYHRIVPGTYKRLRHEQRGTVMSNVPMEIHTNMEFIFKASGSVLINGLGLGMILTELFKKPDVTHVTVVELDPHVIALTSPHFRSETDSGRLSIVNANCFEYTPPEGVIYDAVWHDIWDDICDLNLLEMSTLKKKYATLSKWQGCWAEEDCQRMKDQLNAKCEAVGKSYAAYLQFAAKSIKEEHPYADI